MVDVSTGEGSILLHDRAYLDIPNFFYSTLEEFNSGNDRFCKSALWETSLERSWPLSATVGLRA